MHRTLLDITVEVIRESINGMFGFLKFTVETGCDFVDGWLPTLDCSLRVNEMNVVDYKFYEKPTPPTPPSARPRPWERIRRSRVFPMTWSADYLTPRRTSHAVIGRKWWTGMGENY